MASVFGVPGVQVSLGHAASEEGFEKFELFPEPDTARFVHGRLYGEKRQPDGVLEQPPEIGMSEVVVDLNVDDCVELLRSAIVAGDDVCVQVHQRFGVPVQNR